MAAKGFSLKDHAAHHLPHVTAESDPKAAVRLVLTESNNMVRAGLLADRQAFEDDPNEYVRSFHERSDAALKACDEAAALIDETVKAIFS